jgi:hypothetical protein
MWVVHLLNFFLRDPAKLLITTSLQTERKDILHGVPKKSKKSPGVNKRSSTEGNDIDLVDAQYMSLAGK